jgi:hypothetical protein
VKGEEVSVGLEGLVMEAVDVDIIYIDQHLDAQRNRREEEEEGGSRKARKRDLVIQVRSKVSTAMPRRSCMLVCSSNAERKV